MHSAEETLLALELPYRERFLLRRRVFEGGEGPRVAVVAGVHGDELEGLYVCHRLAAWLEELQRSRPEALNGQVALYPAVNPLALDGGRREMPVFDADLNRSFPGHPEGTLPGRVADALLGALKGTDLVVDVHASNRFLREVAQVRLNRDYAGVLLPHARRMNVDLVWMYGPETLPPSTLASTLNARDTPCLVLEMGVGMRITPALAEQALSGLLNAWQGLGLLAADLDLPPLSRVPLRVAADEVHEVHAEVGGLFVPELGSGGAQGGPWARVRGGDVLGQVVSPLHGAPLARVRAPADGMLFTVREYPLVYEGSLLARVAAVEVQR